MGLLLMTRTLSFRGEFAHGALLTPFNKLWFCLPDFRHRLIWVKPLGPDQVGRKHAPGSPFTSQAVYQHDPAGRQLPFHEFYSSAQIIGTWRLMVPHGDVPRHDSEVARELRRERIDGQCQDAVDTCPDQPLHL